MKIATTRFGELEIEESRIIHMPDGIIGFEEKRFVILNPEKMPFCWFQAVDNPDMAFVVIDPTVFVPEYQVRLTREEYDRLEVRPDREVLVLALVTMAPDPGKITANLQGPIVLNPESMLARQIVLEDGNYGTRHPLFAKGEQRQARVNGTAKNQAMRKVAAQFDSALQSHAAL